ncbi:sigma-70 family RNA polymerase sigma factor [Anoxybacillus rupiensis]|uniref:Sigma-70 family RNA polymerase sigma factor n=1 Tax=Anoxybacteroides rupiense TaxID=311460 RepID=A0ABD5IQQ8_9BACL|nr:sigma-70 family RNA polymerase sigma factor [Anoxybacillus rupiensis]
MINARGIEYEDAHSVGMIGLIKAYRNFNPDYGWKFATYAVPMITGEVQRFIREFNPGVKFPRKVKELALKIRHLALENETVQVIAETLNVSQEKVKDAMDYIQNEKPRLFSDVVYGDGKNEDITIEEQVSNEEDFSSIFVQDFLNILSERERQVVRMLMEGYFQEQIAEVIGVSQAHVSRMLQKIRDKYNRFQQGEEIDKPKEKRRGVIRMPKVTKEEYEAMKKEGKTDKEIAEHFGIKQQTITYYKTKWAAEEAREKATNKQHDSQNINEQERLVSELKQRLSERDVTIAKLQNEIAELKKQLAEKDRKVNEAVSSLNLVANEAEETIKHLRTENEQLQKEIDRYIKVTEESKQQTRRVAVLEKKNRRLLKMLVFAVEGLDDL